MNRASGTDELARAAGITPRSAQRWHHAFRDLVYFPNTECEALGLVHLHVMLTEPRGAWEQWPYAIRAERVVRQPGDDLLYLHCLVPRDHETDVRALLEELRSERYATAVDVVTSHDPWQVMQGTTSVAIRHTTRNAWDVIERYPLVLPVIFEMTEERRSIPDVWQAISNRLGKRVWEYLPEGVHPLPHNGKVYVTQALRLLNESFLIRQHIIRFPQDLTIDVLARITLPFPDVARFAGTAVDIFPTNENEHLVRMSSTAPLLRRILTKETAITECWFVDHQATRPRVQFAYDLLFDPATTEWRFPRQAIKRRIAR